MGLDMYLSKRHYVKNWAHNKEKYTVLIKKNGKAVDYIKTDKISEVIEDVMTWRKANHIHKWFVDNVQEGNDDCKEYWVSRKDLETLLTLCDRVIAGSKLVSGKIANGKSFIDGKWVKETIDGKLIKDPTVAKELLPTEEGFFFGGTDYDEYYLLDVMDTKKALEEALKSNEGEYYYSSSW